MSPADSGVASQDHVIFQKLSLFIVAHSMNEEGKTLPKMSGFFCFFHPGKSFKAEGDFFKAHADTGELLLWVRRSHGG